VQEYWQAGKGQARQERLRSAFVPRRSKDEHDEHGDLRTCDLLFMLVAAAAAASRRDARGLDDVETGAALSIG
jgi:hypothetical protein